MTDISHLEPILLVEDDPDDAFFVRRALEAAQIANPLVEFTNAEETRGDVMQRSATFLPVLFILDVQLSGNESGIDLLRWLRQQALPLGATPAIMLTGSEHPKHSAESGRLGVIEFLQKPITEDALIKAVRTVGVSVVSSLVSGRLRFRLDRRQ